VAAHLRLGGLAAAVLQPAFPGACPLMRWGYLPAVDLASPPRRGLEALSRRCGPSRHVASFFPAYHPRHGYGRAKGPLSPAVRASRADKIVFPGSARPPASTRLPGRIYRRGRPRRVGHLHHDSCHEGPRLVVAGLLRLPAGPPQGIVGRWAVSSWIMRGGTGYLPPLRHVQPAIRRRS